MNNNDLAKQLQRNIDKGYRYAYHYRSNGTLSGALTFKMVSTCEENAERKIKSTFAAEKHPKIWNLEKELLRLSRKLEQ